MPVACTFCAIVAGDAAAHIVMADETVVAFLDQRPLFPGHVLIVPRAHHETLLDIPPGLTAPLFDSVRRVAAAVTSSMASQGTFVAMNNVVSQSVPHLHVHVVPRTRGDGLRGFFWPRQRYPSEAEMADVAGRIAAALRN
ncbi:MAG TPA: HIT family protein [Acidimicrobiales bacterium]|nr:HIT family protein [Acidimicrobiales bacterium]